MLKSIWGQKSKLVGLLVVCFWGFHLQSLRAHQGGSYLVAQQDASQQAPSQQELEDELDDELAQEFNDEPGEEGELSADADDLSSDGIEILDLNELENNLEPDFEAELDEDVLEPEEGSADTPVLAEDESSQEGVADQEGSASVDDETLAQDLAPDLEAELDTEMEVDLDADASQQAEAPPAAVEPAVPSESFAASKSRTDAPDYAYESSLYRIYRNFLSTPMSSEQWETMRSDRGTEDYKVQQGDTLWDISKTFFGDGHYWPKVWSLNGAIFNPHRIDTDTNLTFVMGSESEPPSIAVGASPVGDTPVGALQTDALFEDESTRQQDAQIAENLDPIVGPSGMLRKLPPSLPAYSLRPTRTRESLTISENASKVSQIEKKLVVSQYVASRMPATVGQIKETQTGGQWASKGEYVFVHFRDPSIQVGDRFLAIVDKGRNLKSESSLRGSMGRTIEVQGELELVEKLPRRRFYRARVNRNLYPVEVGAKLQKARLKVQKINAQAPHGTVQGRVIGGQYAKRRFFFSIGDVLYINRGTVRGLQEGQALEVRPNRGLRFLSTRMNRETRSIGRVQIIKATPRFATAVVVKMREAIYAGDFVAPIQR